MVTETTDNLPAKKAKAVKKNPANTESILHVGSLPDGMGLQPVQERDMDTSTNDETTGKFLTMLLS